MQEVGITLNRTCFRETIVRELLEREEERERKRQKTREVKALLDAEEPDDQLEANPRRERVTIEEAVVLQDNLKDDQRWFYKLITEAIEGQAQRELAPQNPDAICEFLTGVGGTGKSALIAAIRAWLNCRFESNRSVCVVSAPTGIAAKNIHGYTLHSVLSFEVQQGGIGQYLPLIDRKRSTLSSQMKEVRLLIVDECSMVSNVMLLKLHRRLCEIGDRGEGSPLQVTASQLSDAAWSSILRPSYSGHLFV
jgi:DNA replication protein DnaC